ncbi:type II toxin-antitoxin system RelB/DinJ family antitoxin [Actinobacillus minor]|uniref:type II toxin-antitoxin system RelB/DinJ family antitoxin n=1 Tax=Actinobacillus minor TaxID=51047 RepID=UPI0023F07903|nr:type II toxin-antitoxin system RelB/DinJ family antitoxin [Actinobacillus minor]MDD6911178.1 type II toxin-antitoxin system RelB/DinJ family antitoxin [Actinobacillus minor]MDY4712485.1 type II toxin-antitoxin system RelB/DinJ family antitoxin [Actinobacillus minor]
MSNLNIRIDDMVKQQAFEAFDNLGISPSDAIRSFLAYVAETGRMPIKQIIVSDEDAELYELVKKRLNEPEKIKNTTLDELFS